MTGVGPSITMETIPAKLALDGGLCGRLLKSSLLPLPPHHPLPSMNKSPVVSLWAVLPQVTFQRKQNSSPGRRPLLFSLDNLAFLGITFLWIVVGDVFILCIRTLCVCASLGQNISEYIQLPSLWLLLFSHEVMSNPATPWTVASQVPLSTEFPRQEYWSGLPFPSPGELPDPGIEQMSPALAGIFFTTEPPGKPTISLPHSITSRKN